MNLKIVPLIINGLRILRLQGFKARGLLREILTPSLSPSDGERVAFKPGEGLASVGTSTFSRTEHCGSRQWSWKTKPMDRLRNADSSFSGMV
jgi:hypothetical protein